jgi:hypothetical protein
MYFAGSPGRDFSAKITTASEEDKEVEPIDELLTRLADRRP